MASVIRAMPPSRLGRRGEPHHRRVQVVAVDDQLAHHRRRCPGRRRSAPARGGAAAAWRCRGGSPAVAPASIAATVCSNVASVCPIASDTPAATSWRIGVERPGPLGGDRHHRRCHRGRRRSARRTASGVGSTMCAGFCAPHRAADRNGPSRWMPTIRCRTSPGGSVEPARRAAAHAAASSSTGAVTKLASVVVVPWRRWNAAAATDRVGITGRHRVAAATVDVDVDEAGHDRPPAGRTGHRRGRPVTRRPRSARRSISTYPVPSVPSRHQHPAADQPVARTATGSRLPPADVDAGRPPAPRPEHRARARRRPPASVAATPGSRSRRTRRRRRTAPATRRGTLRHVRYAAIAAASGSTSVAPARLQPAAEHDHARIERRHRRRRARRRAVDRLVPDRDRARRRRPQRRGRPSRP